MYTRYASFLQSHVKKLNSEISTIYSIILDKSNDYNLLFSVNLTLEDETAVVSLPKGRAQVGLKSKLKQINAGQNNN